MSLEPIGLITLVIGLFCIAMGTRATSIAFICFCTLGSAAAILLGGANIQPAHLFLIFVAFSALSWKKILQNALEGFAAPKPGFWLLCFAVYGVLSSYLMPRLFNGATYIVPLGSTDTPITSSGVVPLGPVSSNVTQSMYLIGDLACFAIVLALASTAQGFKSVAYGLIAYSCINVIFGFVDMLTAATGTQGALEFIRNAQYTFHDEESIGSLRRIIGSWPEASAFAAMTLGACGFTGTLWLYQRHTTISGILAILSLAFVLLSTSSSGLAGSGFVLAALYLVALFRCGSHPRYRVSSAFVLFCPLMFCLIALSVALNDSASSRVAEYANVLLFDKSSSPSGIQRSAWNALAWENFKDTSGLGVGLGTNRTSSYILAVLSNVGIPGAAFVTLFLLSAFAVRRGMRRSYYSDLRMAATVGAMSLLVGAIIAGGTVDLGLLFYIFAGLASSNPEGQSSSYATMPSGTRTGLDAMAQRLDRRHAEQLIPRRHIVRLAGRHA